MTLNTTENATMPIASLTIDSLSTIVESSSGTSKPLIMLITPLGSVGDNIAAIRNEKIKGKEETALTKYPVRMVVTVTPMNTRNRMM
jgi:hypothetical protein